MFSVETCAICSVPGGQLAVEIVRLAVDTKAFYQQMSNQKAAAAGANLTYSSCEGQAPEKKQ
ncbi:MAG: hypothetical protein K0R67_1762 [Paenibacillus sp.]|nr:hypothetical protein [Paenibacillus sp.]